MAGLTLEPEAAKAPVPNAGGKGPPSQRSNGQHLGVDFPSAPKTEDDRATSSVELIEVCPADHLEDDRAGVPSSEEEALAEEFEKRIQAQASEQFQKLKYEAQAIYGQVTGLPGVRTPEKWAEMLEKAGDDIGNGRFIVRCLGAERYLDTEIVAVLLTFRQNLIAELEHATAADIMMIDTAIVAYYNMLRAQRWMGDLSLVVERELFGQEPLDAFHGQTIGTRLEDQIRRLGEIILPLQDRAGRMMIRSLDALRSGGRVGAKRKRLAKRRRVLAA